MNWRTDLLAELADALNNWTPRTWWRKLLRNWLVKQIVKEIQEEHN